MLRGDSVKDETGCQADFAERGASASRMAAAQEFWTVNPRLLGMAGEPNHAVSANTQAENEGRCNIAEAASSGSLGKYCVRATHAQCYGDANWKNYCSKNVGAQVKSCACSNVH